MPCEGVRCAGCGRLTLWWDYCYWCQRERFFDAFPTPGNPLPSEEEMLAAWQRYLVVLRRHPWNPGRYGR